MTILECTTRTFGLGFQIQLGSRNIYLALLGVAILETNLKIEYHRLIHSNMVGMTGIEPASSSTH